VTRPDALYLEVEARGPVDWRLVDTGLFRYIKYREYGITLYCAASDAIIDSMLPIHYCL
jgi:hypothetical protein